MECFFTCKFVFFFVKTAYLSTCTLEFSIFELRFYIVIINVIGDFLIFFQEFVTSFRICIFRIFFCNFFFSSESFFVSVTTETVSDACHIICSFIAVSFSFVFVRNSYKEFFELFTVEITVFIVKFFLVFIHKFSHFTGKNFVIRIIFIISGIIFTIEYLSFCNTFFRNFSFEFCFCHQFYKIFFIFG